VERDLAIRLALLATLAGEHLLMLGPPGTAKSLIARRLRLAIDEGTYFERLLTRFTVPEELFGPLSIKGLEEDRYHRLTESYLPTASIAFLDEIFKANSAILNALLTLLNEREFDNGAVRDKTPLVAVIGASNELPEGEELDALFDRFLLRLHVGPVSKEAFPDLLSLRGQSTPNVGPTLQLSVQELQEVQRAAERVVVPEDVVALLCELRDWCTAENIQVSDRRWRKVVKLLQVSAVTNDRGAVSIWDCWLLQHCLWDSPETREKVYAWYEERVGTSAVMDSSKLTTIVNSWEAQLKRDMNARSQQRDAEGRLLYAVPNGKPAISPKVMMRAGRDGEPLFLAPNGSYSEHGYQRRQIQDRQNGGAGFTEAELDALVVNDPQRGAIHFSRWTSRDTYLKSQANWLLHEAKAEPLLEPLRHKRVYVEKSMSELDGLLVHVAEYTRKLEAHIDSLQRLIRDHIWVSSSFATPASRNLKQTLGNTKALLARIENLKSGFGSLPVEKPAESASTVSSSPPAATTKRGKA
jgi:MoxR-like ATPase